jgi:copper chaperone CopZ
MKHQYTITGMHCGACVEKVQSALEAVDGVEAAEVTLEPPRAAVTMNRHIETDTLHKAVVAKGSYGLEEIEDERDQDAGSTNEQGDQEESKESLYPLFLIVGYIAGAVLLVAYATSQWEPMTLMRHFMAGFFLVFSFFKLLDPAGFVSAYRGYDLIARRSVAYARAYPFIELALGIVYLVNVLPIAVNLVTLGLMLVGAAGVLKALLDKRAIRCACLGTALNLPMTKVTLVEDLTMAAMAAGMLVLYLL